MALLWLTLALSVPCYSRDLPAPVIGLAYSQPVKIELDSHWVVPYLRQGIRGLPITRARAVAVYVVAHELGHVRSSFTEVGADIWARVNWGRVVRLLGGTRAQARVSSRLIWGPPAPIATHILFPWRL